MKVTAELVSSKGLYHNKFEEPILGSVGSFYYVIFLV